MTTLTLEPCHLTDSGERNHRPFDGWRLTITTTVYDDKGHLYPKIIDVMESAKKETVIKEARRRGYREPITLKAKA